MVAQRSRIVAPFYVLVPQAGLDPAEQIVRVMKESILVAPVGQSAPDLLHGLLCNSESRLVSQDTVRISFLMVNTERRASLSAPLVPHADNLGVLPHQEHYRSHEPVLSILGAPESVLSACVYGHGGWIYL